MILGPQRMREMIHADLGIDAGINSAVRLLSNLYQLPTAEGVLGEFSLKFSMFQARMVPRGYQDRRMNCISFALSAMSYARQMHGRTDDDADAALAVGIYNYRKLDGNWHILNLWFVNDYEKPELMFWEPQNQRKVTLQPEEILSCDLCLF